MNLVRVAVCVRGRYDRFFTDDERAWLSTMPPDDLSPEIGLLRFCIERFTGSLSGRTVTIPNLRLVARSLEILGKLISAQMEVHSPLDEFNAIVDETLRLTRIKLGLLPPDPVPEPAQPPDGHAPLEPGLPPFREAEGAGENTPCPIPEPSGSMQAGRPASRLRKPSIRPPPALAV